MPTLRIVLVLSLFAAFVFAGRDESGGDNRDDSVAISTTFTISTTNNDQESSQAGDESYDDDDESYDDDDESYDDDDDDCDYSSSRGRRDRDRDRGRRRSKCNRDKDMDDVSSTIMPDVNELISSTEDIISSTSNDGKVRETDIRVTKDIDNIIQSSISSTSNDNNEDRDIFSTVISSTNDPCQNSVNLRPCLCFATDDCQQLSSDTGRCQVIDDRCSEQAGFNIDDLTQSDTTPTAMIGVFGMIGIIILIILIAICYYFCKKDNKIENGLKSIKSMEEDSDEDDIDDINDLEGDDVERTNMTQIPDDSDDENGEQTNIIKIDIESDDETFQALKY